MRTVFIGSPPFAVEAFVALLKSSVAPVGLITSPESRAGRGRKPRPNPLVDAAIAHNPDFPILRPERASSNEAIAWLGALRPDLGVVVSYGQLLSQVFLDTPRLGCINVHGSLLPRWRGASPVQAAIKAGDNVSGVCIQKMVKQLDAGDVLCEQSISVSSQTTAPELFSQLASMSADLLPEFLEAHVGCEELPLGQAQDLDQVTHCRKIIPNDALCDWGLSALQLDRHVRAMTGWPCARTFSPEGTELKIISARVISAADFLQMLEGDSVAQVPGSICIFEHRLIVACGEEFLELLRIQRPGKAALDCVEFLRGFSLNSGDVFTNKKDD